VNYDWEIIADRLSKAGWSWGCVSAIDSQGQTIWIVDAHCGDGKRYVVRAEEKLTGFLNWNRRSGSDRRNPRNLRFNDVFVPSKNCLDTVSGGLNIHAALSRLGVSPQELHLALFPQG
jgi:hypothetical protein